MRTVRSGSILIRRVVAQFFTAFDTWAGVKEGIELMANEILTYKYLLKKFLLGKHYILENSDNVHMSEHIAALAKVGYEEFYRMDLPTHNPPAILVSFIKP